MYRLPWYSIPGIRQQEWVLLYSACRHSAWLPRYIEVCVGSLLVGTEGIYQSVLVCGVVCADCPFSAHAVVWRIHAGNTGTIYTRDYYCLVRDDSFIGKQSDSVLVRSCPSRLRAVNYKK